MIKNVNRNVKVDIDSTADFMEIEFLMNFIAEIILHLYWCGTIHRVNNLTLQNWLNYAWSKYNGNTLQTLQLLS